MWALDKRPKKNSHNFSSNNIHLIEPRRTIKVMTSSLTDDPNSILDHNFLTNLQHEDQDILDEFLDQRVYDSIGSNTPTGPIKLEPDLLETFYMNDRTNQINTPFNYSSYSPNPEQVPVRRDNDYLFVEPGNYQSTTVTNVNSELSSPYDKSNHSSPLSSGEQSAQPNGQVNTSVHGPANGQLSDFEFIRDELSKIKFGNYFMNPCPKTINVPDPSYLDTTNDDKLPYKLLIKNLPSYSRVETQIKLKFTLSPPPPHALLYIPQDLISKNKFCLNEPVERLHPKLKENLLYLDSYVLTSDLKKSCNICARCIKREQKRASRRKTAFGGDDEPAPEITPAGVTPMTTASGVVKNNPTSWADEKMMKKAIIFNCKEIMSFPAPNGLNNDTSKSLELSARIICYCRHHKESEGFRLLFVVRDGTGQVVAKQLTSPIMIMDRKKNTSIVGSKSSTNLNELDESFESGSKRKLQSNSNSEDDLDMDNQPQQSIPPSISNTMANTPVVESNQLIADAFSQADLINSFHPLSPHSLDDSEAQTTDRGLKRKKLSVDDSYNSSSNPMYNGSASGFSPLSNSDTNTSTTNNFKGNLGNVTANAAFTQPLPQQATLPSIQRIIPAQGPIRGGIEVTLLGFNFRPGLVVKFGANQALATHCWSDSTIVTYLPPASQPGQVLVSFENHESMTLGGPQQQQIFTYTDDTDRQLIELALQIVGLKMNGKLEDAKNIARRIVGTDTNKDPTGSVTNPTIQNNMQNSMNQANIEWFDNAHKAVEQLTKSDLSTQEILINFLSLVDLPNCPIIIPNWQLCNNQGQTLLHLATLKNYSHLIKFLITHGCKIDLQDNQGLTPLFIALMCGHRDLIKIFVDCKSNWNLKLSNSKYLKDYCDLNVLDIFSKLEAESENEDFGKVLVDASTDAMMSKSLSTDSLNLMFTMNYGFHISKMVMEDNVQSVESSTTFDKSERHSVRKELTVKKESRAPTSASSMEESNYSSDFADSEFESNDDDELAETDDYDDYEDNDYNDAESVESTAQEGVTNDVESSDATARAPTGLWQKVKNVFSNDDEENLPSYDDLFPFGPSSFHSKPKSTIEQSLNEPAEVMNLREGSSSSEFKIVEDVQDDGVTSDSSEDMIISYINHPRKTFENDKMLLFFWFPVLVGIIGLFFMVSVMGYRIEVIETIKVFVRDTIGNIMVGDERIGKVFNSDNAVLHATRKFSGIRNQ